MLRRIKTMLKKSITYGDTLPRSMQGRPLSFRDWNEKNAVEYGYKKSAIVYACINLIAKSAASVPWKTYRLNRGTWKEIEGHQLTQLIEKPNPFMSRKDLIERMTHGLYLGGNSVFSKIRAGGGVVELWPIQNDNIKPVPDKQKFISHYLYEGDGHKIKIEPTDLIHNQFINPNNIYWGMAPIRAAAMTIDTDIEAVRWNMHALQNRAVTDGAFIFNEPLTKEQWEEARAMVKEQHQGSKNARTPWVLGAGSQWQNMSMSPQEMDFIESRRYSRQEIASIFGVPLPLISIYDDATLANIETARKIFWLDTLIPYLSDIRSALNGALTYEFGSELFLDFDVSAVDALQQNESEKINNAKNLFSMGIPFNEVNKRLDLGFDEIEGGDIGYLPANLVPTDIFNGGAAANTQTEQQNEPNNEDNDEPKGLGLERQVKAVNLKTEAHKAFYWKATERRRTSYDLAMTRKISKIFNDLGEKSAAAYKKDGLKGVKAAIDKSEKDINTLFKSTWISIFEEFAPEIYKQIMEQAKDVNNLFYTKAEEEPEDAFSPWNEDIMQYIIQTVGLKVTGVLDFTKQEIAAIVADEIAAERGMTEIAAAIKNKFSDFSRYRSYLIARTEVAGASNAANYSAGQKAAERLERSNIKVYRVWVTSRDERVRDSHKLMEGKIVGIDEPFKVMEEDEEGNLKEKGELTYPAEYMAAMPSDTINCRCTIAYETRKE